MITGPSFGNPNCGMDDWRAIRNEGEQYELNEMTAQANSFISFFSLVSRLLLVRRRYLQERQTLLVLATAIAKELG
jgi:hypothetical protein